MSASRGAVRIPLPIRSPSRAARTTGQAVARRYRAFAATLVEYPVRTSVLRRPSRSESQPLPSFRKAEALSVTPSTTPMIVGVAARTFAR
jgi:hypothetical protein